jgi:hypothetical protein
MNNRQNAYGGVFCSPGERQVCTIGTGYISNYVSGGGASHAGATLTNKRIYFSGSVFRQNANGNFVNVSRRQIVNVRDVTGTGYDFYRPLYLIVCAVIFGIFSALSFMGGVDGEEVLLLLSAVFFVAAVICVISYFVKRLTLLAIEYAGGNIAFDVRWIQKHEQDDFIRNIHLVKDKIYSNTAEEQGFSNAVSSAVSQNSAGGGDYDEIPDL